MKRKNPTFFNYTIESEKLPIQTIKCIPVSYLIPTSMLPLGVWEKISQDAPFSWGDNNRSMITASDFAKHCEERLDDSPKVKKFLKRVRSFGEMYIDLES